MVVIFQKAVQKKTDQFDWAVKKSVKSTKGEHYVQSKFWIWKQFCFHGNGELFYINGGSGSNGGVSGNGVNAGNGTTVNISNCSNCSISISVNSGNGVGNSSGSSSGGGGK